MSDKLTVDVDDVVEAAQQRIGKLVREALEAGKADRQEIDIHDSDAVGEWIREQGWTSYDLSIDLEQFADEDELAKAVGIPAFLRENDTQEVIDALVDNEGLPETLGAVLSNCAVADVANAAVEKFGRAAMLAEVLERCAFDDEAVVAEFRVRSVEIVNAIGKDEVLATVAKLDWLPAAPAPAPTDRPTWEEVAAFIRGYGAK